MLKYSYEDHAQELKTWVDPSTGPLNIQIGKEAVEVPYEIGMELVYVLKQDSQPTKK